MTRHGIKDGGLSFFSDISLLLIDEVHLLNDPRGAALEAIVSRVKMLARKPELKLTPLAQVRLVAVSATIPNIEDLGKVKIRSPVTLKYLIFSILSNFKLHKVLKFMYFIKTITAEWLEVPVYGIKRYYATV